MSNLHEEAEDDETMRTILVVEDDRDIGLVLVDALKEEASCETILVHDGFEALELTRSIKPDLLIVDYQLPSMNGLELYERLQSWNRLGDIPILFMSASPPLHELAKRHLHHINKPFDLDELFQNVERLLAG